MSAPRPASTPTKFFARSGLWLKDRLELDADRYFFWASFWLSLPIKFIIAVWLPVTGDEAYYVQWGRFPAWGYYDHPPLIGWIMAGLLQIGDAPWLIRLPSILLFSAIALGIYRLLAPRDHSAACLIAASYVISPVNLLGVLITTDIPLIFFSFFSVFFLARALADGRRRNFLLSGLCLGLAFYSKYFAVLLGLSMVLFLLWHGWRTRRGPTRQGRRLLVGAGLMLAALLPFVLANLFWNATHCWYNLVFNLVTRNVGETVSSGKVGLYLLMMLYLATPPLLLHAFQARRALGRELARPETALYACCFILPVAAFAVLSLEKEIGLHWVLSFIPFLYLPLIALGHGRLRRLARFMAGFSLCHLALLLALALMPLSTWSAYVSRYESLVMTVKPQPLADILRGYAQQGATVAADGFTLASILGYHARMHVAVFGQGSFHGRQDDLLTDFRPLNGRRIVIVSKGQAELRLYTPYFRQLRTRFVTIDGARFNFIDGEGFDYPAYRAGVLQPVRDKYYPIPGVLPCWQCDFIARYGLK